MYIMAVARCSLRGGDPFSIRRALELLALSFLQTGGLACQLSSPTPPVSANPEARSRNPATMEGEEPRRHDTFPRTNAIL
jgi:hypothetical protein